MARDAPLGDQDPETWEVRWTYSSRSALPALEALRVARDRLGPKELFRRQWFDEALEQILEAAADRGAKADP